MRKKFKLTGGGVNKDAPPFELSEGEWSDCTNVRFRNGVARRRGAIRGLFQSIEAPYFITTYITAAARLLVGANLTRVQSNNSGVVTEITRYTDGKVISTLTRVGTTATLTTATAHGRTNGDNISVWYALVNGSTSNAYNGNFSITVTGATTFTYTMASDPGASATVDVAQYSYNSDVFGAAATSNFTGAADDKWTGGSFNGILILNNPVDGPYYWNGDTSTKLRRLPGWAIGEKCDAIFFYKNYIIALAPTIGGVKYDNLIMWGAAAEPGALPIAWDAASTNDAGDSPLPAETGGALVDGMSLGDMGFAFDQDACYALQYIGGNDVFRIFRLPGVEGVNARHCITRVPESPNNGGPGLVFLSNGDVKFLNGASAYSIADGRVKDWLNTMITTNAQKCFVVTHLLYSEVWIMFPESGGDSCTMAAVWNYREDTWGIFDFGTIGYSCGTSGLVASGLTDETIDSDTGTIDSDPTTIDQTTLSAQQYQLLLGTGEAGDYKVGAADAGATLDFGSNTITWALERRGLDLGDQDFLKFIKSSRWNFDALAGNTATIYHGAQTTADAEPTYLTYSGTHTQGTTNWVNKFGPTGRFLFIRATGTSDMGLRSFEIDFGTAGRY